MANVCCHSNSSKRLWLLLVALVSVIFFFFHFYDVLAKYLEEEKSVSFQYKNVASKKLPMVLFCNHAPFNKEVSKEDLLDPVAFESVLSQPVVTLMETNETNKLKHKWEALDTVHNGRCRKFIALQTLEANSYLGFKVTSGSVDVYFLEEGEEPQLTFQHWLSKPASAVIGLEDNAVVTLSVKHFNLLRHDDICRSSPDCLQSHIEQALKDFECLPPALANITKSLSKTACPADMAEEAAIALDTALDTVKKSAFTCSNVCPKTFVEVRHTSFSPISGVWPWVDEGFGLVLYYPSEMETVLEAYLVMDLNSLISTLAMGVFILVVTLYLASQFIEWLNGRKSDTNSANSNSLVEPS